MDDVTRGTRDEAMPYGVNTIRLRISWPAPPAPQGYDGRMWRMRLLRGWTGGQAADAGPFAGADQGGDYADEDAAIPIASAAQQVSAGSSLRATLDRVVTPLMAGPTRPLAPVQLVANAPEDDDIFRRVGPNGQELSIAEELRLDRFNKGVRELGQLEPGNPKLNYVTSPDWIPNEIDVEKLEDELGAARGRATGRSNAPTNPSLDQLLSRDASAPVGRSGSPLKILPSTNQPAIIAGRYYTGHVLDEMQSEGILPSVVEHVYKNGIEVRSSDPTTIRKYDPVNNVTVVFNHNGHVVTAFRGGRSR